MYDTRDGFTDIHRQFTGSDYSSALFTGSDYSSALRDVLLQKFGRTALYLAFVIMICPDVDDVDDARMIFTLVPEFCVRIRLWGMCRGTYVLL